MMHVDRRAMQAIASDALAQGFQVTKVAQGKSAQLQEHDFKTLAYLTKSERRAYVVASPREREKVVAKARAFACYLAMMQG